MQVAYTYGHKCPIQTIKVCKQPVPYSYEGSNIDSLKVILGKALKEKRDDVVIPFDVIRIGLA